MFINFYYFLLILPKSLSGWLTWGWYCVFLVFSGPGSMRVHCHGTQHLASNSWFCRHVLQLSNSFHDTCAPWLANSFMLVHTCAPAVQQLPYHMHMPAAKQLCIVNMFMVHMSWLKTRRSRNLLRLQAEDSRCRRPQQWTLSRCSTRSQTRNLQLWWIVVVMFRQSRAFSKNNNCFIKTFPQMESVLRNEVV